MATSITPCLWYDQQAQEAGTFYTTHLPEAKIVAQSPVVTEIEVWGQHLTLIDGGPMYQPNPSISLFYVCDSLAEINRLWAAFSEGGSLLVPLAPNAWSARYGWLNDRFGVSWQFWLGNLEAVGQRITPSLLFTGAQHGRAEEALNYYASIFKNAQREGLYRYGGEEATEVASTLKFAQLSLNGQKLMFTDSAQPHPFTFSEGVSLALHCGTQAEIDYYWEKLTANGKESRCGWLKDQFGVSWQVLPHNLKQADD